MRQLLTGGSNNEHDTYTAIFERVTMMLAHRILPQRCLKEGEVIDDIRIYVDKDNRGDEKLVVYGLTTKQEGFARVPLFRP